MQQNPGNCQRLYPGAPGDDASNPIIYMSKHSQYSVESKSACGVIALEMSLNLLQPSATVSEELLDKVLLFCSNIECDHLDVQDVLKDCRRFALGLHVMDVKQMEAQNLEGELRTYLTENRLQMPFSVIITNPPETVALICLSNSNYIFFDSHPRPNFRTAHTICYGSLHSAQRRIAALLPKPDNMEEHARGYAQFVVVQFSGTPLNDLPSIDEWKNHTLIDTVAGNKMEETIRKQTEKINRQKEALKQCQSEIGRLKSENDRFKQVVFEMVREMANENMRTSKKQLDAIEKLQREVTGSSSASITMPLTSKNHVTCLICKKRYTIEFAFCLKATGCNHEMCRTCGIRFIKTRASSQNYPICCPETTCKRMIHETDISLLLQNDTLLQQIVENQLAELQSMC